MNAVDGPARDHATARTERRRALLLFVLVVVVLPVVFVSIAGNSYPSFSRLDEQAHLDYVRRVGQREIPRVGDKLEQATAIEVACLGVAAEQPPDCDPDEVDVDTLAASGYQYQAQQPPLYYVVTAVLARALRAGPVDDFLTAARLTGMFWLMTGLGVLWVALRRLGLTVWGTAVGVALAGLSPPIVQQASTVTNDAASILIGAAALLAYEVLARRRDLAVVVLVAAGALLAVLTKPLALMAVGVAALALLLRARRERWDALGAGAAVVLPSVAALVGYFGWNAVRDRRANIEYSVVVEALLGFFEKVDSYPADRLFDHWDIYFTVWWSNEAGILWEPYLHGVLGVIGLLIVVPATMRWILDRRTNVLVAEIGGAYLAIAAFAVPALITLSYLTASRAGGVNARYGLVLIPFSMFAVAVRCDEDRRFRIACTAAAMLAVVVSLIAMFDSRVP